MLSYKLGKSSDMCVPWPIIDSVFIYLWPSCWSGKLSREKFTIVSSSWTRETLPGGQHSVEPDVCRCQNKHVILQCISPSIEHNLFARVIHCESTDSSSFHPVLNVTIRYVKSMAFYRLIRILWCWWLLRRRRDGIWIVNSESWCVRYRRHHRAPTVRHKMQCKF